MNGVVTKTWTEEEIEQRIQSCKTYTQCLNLVRNAARLGHPDIELRAYKHSIKVRAALHKPASEIEWEGYEALYAYEDGLSRKNKRRTRGGGTRKLIQNHGMIGALDRAVNLPDDPTGFTLLKELQIEEYAFEHIVVRHADQFPPETVRKAKERLDRFGKSV